ncbi:MAG: YhcH/YjgK/YiaL family protein [Candidatus Omnitrophica bacterium]|nr:YhcH/YjgK/YiaL family protein [Candidatus Omnitrophota bacterium]
MIYDSLENFKIYLGIHPYFKYILKYFKTYFSDAPLGKHIIYDNMIAIVSEYKLKDILEGFIECHRKYIDIQVVLNGMERIGVCNINSCKKEEYDEERDFQKLTGNVDFILLKKGYFVIFFPQDAHMPQIKNGEKADVVKKLVIKVPVVDNIK